jgi:predicted MFS family arabinose efflux permease
MTFRTRRHHPAPPSAQKRFFLNRTFGLLWSGQTISEMGSHITDTAIPLIAILVLAARPDQVGLLAALSALPYLLFSLPIGIWVDRLPHRPLMLLSDIARAVLLLSLPIAALSGLLRLAQLYIITLLLSTCSICFETAYQAFLPQVVARAQLVEGNSKLGTSSALAEMGGPPLAGGLIQSIGGPLAVLFDAVSFLLSALCLGLIRPREIQPIARAAQRLPFWKELREGLHIVSAHPMLRTLAVYTTVRTFCGGAFAALYTIYIVRDLGIAPALYGVLVALGGAGALIGSLITPHVSRRLGAQRTLLAGALLHGLLALLTPLAGGPVPLLLGVLGISQLIGDIGFALYDIDAISLRQGSISSLAQGRASAVMSFLTGGIAPLGTLLAGIAAEFVGVRLTLLAGACGMLLAGAWLACSFARQNGGHRPD